MRKISFYFLLLFIYCCSSKQQVDLIAHNALIYTIDSNFSTTKSVAVKDGKFIAIGNNEDLLNK